MSKKILFITSSRIGDAILTTGVLNWLTQKYQDDLSLCLAAGPVAMPLFQDWPNVVWRHTFERRGGVAHWMDLWKQARGTSWDWIIDMRGSALSWMLWSKRRSIWHKPKETMHRVQAIGSVVGLPGDDAPAPHLYISKHRQQAMDTHVTGPFMVVAPAANWAGKEWPLDRFQRVTQRLLEGPMKGWRLLVVAAPHEYPRIQGFLDHFQGPRLMAIDPTRSLLDSAALMKRARFFLGNDSGLMHMAACLGVPTVGLFGPSPPLLYDPYGPQGYALRTPESFEDLQKQRAKMPHACFMTGLTEDTVYDAVCHHGRLLGVLS